MEERGVAAVHAGVAVVTGACGGIGSVLATGLANDGYTVALLDLDGTRGPGLADDIRAAGGEAAFVRVDLADDNAVEAAAAAVVTQLGPPAVLVNNAGWDEIQPFAQSTAALRAKVIEINLRGPVTLTHSLLDGLIQTRGRIINISSDAGRVGSSGETVYASAKAGVIGFTKSLAREVARDGVTVNCVAPGPTDTALYRKNPERLREALVRAIPLRRLATPDDILHAVRFFAAPEASYITGQVISVSGGLTMHG